VRRTIKYTASALLCTWLSSTSQDGTKDANWPFAQAFRNSDLASGTVCPAQLAECIVLTAYATGIRLGLRAGQPATSRTGRKPAETAVARNCRSLTNSRLLVLQP
jgi:hypothetical protein